MKRLFKFKSGIVNGNDMRDVLAALPELASRFEQRKNFDEYYYESGPVIEISIQQLNDLSKELSVQINYDTVTILN